MCAKRERDSGNFEEQETESKSRSQKKRESTALQKRGEYLAGLSPAVQKKLPLSSDLLEALAVWRTLKTWEAKRRHMQYIGRLMREQDDPEALLEALDELDAVRRRGALGFQHLESLRDRLLDEDEGTRAGAFEECLGRFPSLERNRLAHLVQGALSEREKKRSPRQARELFRLLRGAAETAESGEA